MKKELFFARFVHDTTPLSVELGGLCSQLILNTILLYIPLTTVIFFWWSTDFLYWFGCFYSYALPCLPCLLCFVLPWLVLFKIILCVLPCLFVLPRLVFYALCIVCLVISYLCGLVLFCLILSYSIFWPCPIYFALFGIVLPFVPWLAFSFLFCSSYIYIPT